jgi:serine/threonine protein kinase
VEDTLGIYRETLSTTVNLTVLDPNSNHVARVNGVGYDTLAEAIQAVPTGTEEKTTVTILKNITLTEAVEIPSNKWVELDGGNHTISGSVSLINNNGKIKLGDFGLARTIIPNNNKKYTYKVVTLWFRAPELLLGETQYTTAIDVWSCGCVLGELLTGICPFQAKDELGLFEKICEKCGTPNELIWPGVTKLPLWNKLCPKSSFPNSFKEHYKNFNNIDDTVMDLFTKMLQLNPKKRITIDDALKHPFFNEHLPKMCSAQDMPRLNKEFHEFEYSQNYKKMKEMKQQEQNVAKKDYGKNDRNDKYGYSGNNKNNFNNFNKYNNKDYKNNTFLGKKHYMD